MIPSIAKFIIHSKQPITPLRTPFTIQTKPLTIACIAPSSIVFAQPEKKSLSQVIALTAVCFIASQVPVKNVFIQVQTLVKVAEIAFQAVAKRVCNSSKSGVIKAMILFRTLTKVWEKISQAPCQFHFSNSKKAEKIPTKIPINQPIIQTIISSDV